MTGLYTWFYKGGIKVDPWLYYWHWVDLAFLISLQNVKKLNFLISSTYRINDHRKSITIRLTIELLYLVITQTTSRIEINVPNLVRFCYNILLLYYRKLSTIIEFGTFCHFIWYWNLWFTIFVIALYNIITIGS